MTGLKPFRKGKWIQIVFVISFIFLSVASKSQDRCDCIQPSLNHDNAIVCFPEPDRIPADDNRRKWHKVKTSSQEALIIKNNNDTIRCLLQLPESPDDIDNNRFEYKMVAKGRSRFIASRRVKKILVNRRIFLPIGKIVAVSY